MGNGGPACQTRQLLCPDVLQRLSANVLRVQWVQRGGGLRDLPDGLGLTEIPLLNVAAGPIVAGKGPTQLCYHTESFQESCVLVVLLGQTGLEGLL